MKKVLLSVCMAVAVAGFTQAQEKTDSIHHRSHHAMKGRHHDEFFKSLNLTDQQKSEIKKLNETHRREMSELKKKDNLTVKDWRGQMESLNKAHREKIQSLLTPEQKEQWQKARKDRMAMRGENSNERFDRLKQTLNLTDEQAAKLKSSRESLQTQMRSIRDDKSLSDDAKKAQRKELMKQQHENFRSILTDDQRKKLDEMKQERHTRKKTV
jgi:Spy/CpxP family protein refolding chaperone